MFHSDGKKTVNDLENHYHNKVKSLLTTIPHKEQAIISFPEFRVQDKIAITPSVTSCCVIILFNDEKKYVLGHYNSVAYQKDHSTKNIFTDDFPNMLKSLEGDSPTQTIVIGGDQLFFKKIIEFLEINHLTLTASYLDEYGTNHIAENLCVKTVMFEPNKKVATVLSPSLFDAEISLAHEHFRLANNQEQLIYLRSLTLDQIGYANKDIAVSSINTTDRDYEKYKRRFSLFSALTVPSSIDSSKNNLKDDHSESSPPRKK